MSKSLTKEQRKNSKYLRRDSDRAMKGKDVCEYLAPKKKPAKRTVQWRPHADIEVE